MRAIIMAGGQGLRLRPYTMVLPKPLIPLDDFPILQIILMQLRNAGVRHVTLALCYKAQQIVRYFGDGRWLDISIEYAITEDFLGTAGPLALIESFVEPALVLNADILTTVDFADVYLTHQHSGALATVVTHLYHMRVPYGVVQSDQYGRMHTIQEKPEQTHRINTGIYVLDPQICTVIAPGQYLDMPQLLQQTIDQGHTVQAYTFIGDWIDIGTTDRFHQAQEMFRRRREHYLPLDPGRLTEAEDGVDISKLGLDGRDNPVMDVTSDISLWR